MVEIYIKQIICKLHLNIIFKARAYNDIKFRLKILQSMGEELVRIL